MLVKTNYNWWFYCWWKNRAVLLTEQGHENAEKLFGVNNLYSIENAMLSHSLDQALKANFIFEKDVDYVVKDNTVVIVDEFTGRLSEGRRFSEGLHQALEAKEECNNSRWITNISRYYFPKLL